MFSKVAHRYIRSAYFVPTLCVGPSSLPRSSKIEFLWLLSPLQTPWLTRYIASLVPKTLDGPASSESLTGPPWKDPFACVLGYVREVPKAQENHIQPARDNAPRPLRRAILVSILQQGRPQLRSPFSSFYYCDNVTLCLRISIL